MFLINLHLVKEHWGIYLSRNIHFGCKTAERVLVKAERYIILIAAAFAWTLSSKTATPKCNAGPIPEKWNVQGTYCMDLCTSCLVIYGFFETR